MIQQKGKYYIQHIFNKRDFMFVVSSHIQKCSTEKGKHNPKNWKKPKSCQARCHTAQT